MPHEKLIEVGDLTEARKKRLEKGGVAPESFEAASFMGINVLQKTDPVLAYLAHSDEREYEKMIQTDIAISAAVEQRVNGLVSQGWEIVPGESQSETALELADFVKAQFDSLPHFGTLRRELLRSIFYGWRPALIDWTSEFEHKGRPHFAIAKIRAQKPWHYELTTDGDLVFTGGLKPVVIPDTLLWMNCTAGSTESPYGEAWLRRLWMLYFISKKVEKMSATAIQRSLGVLKASRGGGTTGALSGSSVDESKVANELRQILDRLNAHNILMELNGWTLEFVDSLELTDSYAKIVELFDTKKRQAIVLQNLTTEIKGFGSRAAAETHNEILESVWKSDAEEEAGWYDEGVIKPVVAINFGMVDPEDMPHFQSQIFSKPDAEMVTAMFEMGAPIKGRPLASAWNVPIDLADEEDEVVMKKQEPPALMLRPDTGEDEREDDDDRGQRRRAAPDDEGRLSDREVQKVLEELGEDVGDEMASYYRGFAGTILDTNPDPKA